MRLNPQRLHNMQKRIQLTMAALLVVFLGFSVFPVQAAEGEGSSIQDGQEIYQLLKSGKRSIQEKSYLKPEQPTVYLTFDDGPSKLTDQVLDILEKEDVKATFFALGEEAKAYPNVVKRIVNSGHALGNHSFNHVYKDLYSDFQNFWDQIQRTEEVFSDIAGVRPQLVRAPGGTYTNFDAYYYYLLEQAGYTVVDWNVDSGDSKRPHVPVNEMIQTIKSTPLEHEITLLFHDGSGHESSVEALPQIIHYYKKLGYSFAPLTTEVKPKQFPVGKSKWSRNMSLSHFQTMLKETRQYVLAHGPIKNEPQDAIQRLVNQTKVVQEESAQILSSVSGVPLQIHVSAGSEFTLESTQYEVRGNQIELSLRVLIEKMGGQVRWEEATKTARAHYGVYDVEYELSTRSLRLYTFGNVVDTYWLADMSLQEGTIIVPLQKTIDLLGGRITQSLIEPGKREVSLAFRQFYGWNENSSFLKNSLFAANF
ncbi:polysaccharide deacetylase [Paenibacillus sp. SYP-B3998]|uniref:Polysaccharide deacetylase n=1 Tax=Paenibacillus sp. SYP-B3998 TaxID=2678564 RepID=A0A6G4A183_9BACL|nr:polysaccharide deacetylase family protein [Paenibacillus sp. SYP-B3998]NEW08100.1 polysaccharide deacetylase [Paenibacillus sp. SYP-B3998]